MENLIITLVVATISYLVYRLFENNRDRWYESTIVYYYCSEEGRCVRCIRSVFTKFLPKNTSKDQMESFLQSLLPDLQERGTINTLSKIDGFFVQIEELSPQGKKFRKEELERFCLQKLMGISKILHPQYCGEQGYELYCKEMEQSEEDSMQEMFDNSEKSDQIGNSMP